MFTIWTRLCFPLWISNFHWNPLFYSISLQNSARPVFKHPPATAWYLLKASFPPRTGIYPIALRTSKESLFSLFSTRLVIKSYHWDHSLRFKTVNCSPEPAIVPISLIKTENTTFLWRKPRNCHFEHTRTKMGVPVVLNDAPFWTWLKPHSLVHWEIAWKIYSVVPWRGDQKITSLDKQS